MTKPYSQDLRDRVIAAVEEEGLSRRAAAARYRLSDATAVRWLQAIARGGVVLWRRVETVARSFRRIGPGLRR